ncbi:response regulator [Sorangium sp. So ce124]|uniref:response regulator n=1 Tax=Sorangium sp. So ce124 TaxID=3133280 RepID=UPI003F5F443E
MSSATASGARTRIILIVDDMPANLNVLVDNLESVGHEVLIAEDGEEALERARLMQPDLILLDVLMPGIDGFETCRRLKADENTRDISVLFMTCLTDAADKLEGFKAGGRRLHRQAIRDWRGDSAGHDASEPARCAKGARRKERGVAACP